MPTLSNLEPNTPIHPTADLPQSKPLSAEPLSPKTTLTPLAIAHALAKACPYDFPNPNDTGSDFVCLGGDLSPSTVLCAYLQGIFPWFDSVEQLAWWCPNPRCVIAIDDFYPAKSLVRVAKKRKNWHVKLNSAFNEVVHACSLPRSYSKDTWIHDSIKQSYGALFELGVGFSIEVYDDSQTLVGGLYGLKIGGGVFGESMFHTVSDASKLAFWALTKLCRHSGIGLIDCQMPNDYLLSLGATMMPRDDFVCYVADQTHPNNPTPEWYGWQFDKPLAWLLD